MSAQVDRFVHDRLPPREQWPNLRYELPELQFPLQSNLVEELLDRRQAKGWGRGPCCAPSAHPHLRAGAMTRGPHLPACWSRTWAWFPATVCCCAAATPSAWRWPGWRWSRPADRGRHHAAAAREGAGRHHRQGAAERWRATSSCWRSWNWRAGAPAVEVVALQRPAVERWPGARPQGRDFTPCPTAADDIAMLAFTPAPPAGPRRPCIRTATCSPPASLAAPRAARHAGGHRDRHRRWPSPSAWAGCCSSRCGPARRSISRCALHARALGAHDPRRRRDHLLHRAHLLRRGAVRAPARRGPARTSVAGEACPTPRASSGRRPPASRCSTASAPPRCSTSSSPRPATEVRRGAIGKVVPGYRRKVVDDDGRSAARHHRQAGGDRPDRLQVPGRPRCRRTT